MYMNLPQITKLNNLSINQLNDEEFLFLLVKLHDYGFYKSSIFDIIC